MKIRGNVIVNISVQELHPHPDNPRRELGDLSELTESIKTAGIVYQNLTVIPGHYDNSNLVDGGYTIIIGHRRCAAAKAAGLKVLPCRIIEDMTLKEQIAMMLEENIQRNDLTIYEQAQSFQLMLDLGETEESLSEKTGFSRQTIKHRVELAKLDKNLLINKAENESFQMSLKDMMLLEKVPDVEERNRILKEADNTSQLSWKVDNYLRDARREKRKTELIELLEKEGITQAPKKFEKERYSSKWETIRWISLDDKKNPSLPKNNKNLYWHVSFNQICIVKEKQLTKSEIAEKESAKRKDRIHRDILSLERELDEYIRQFVMQIADGRQTVPKSLQARMITESWLQMIDMQYCSVQISNMIVYYSGLSLYDMAEENRAEIREKILKMPMLTQMIICEARELKENTPLTRYDNKYLNDNAEKYKKFISLLEGYGFSLKSEYERFIDGTHELWEAEQ